MMKKLLSKIPNWWIVAVAVAIMGALTFIGINFFNSYTNKVEDTAILECNTVQLEQELEFQRTREAEQLERIATLEKLLSEVETETIEVEVFRDRVITEIREVQVEVQAIPDGSLREELSPTTKTFLQKLQEFE